MKPQIIEGEDHSLPEGIYYVGDPCYSLSDELWDEYLHIADFYLDGKTVMLSDGRLVASVSTCWGDGVYVGSDERTYPVDAGVLGAVQAIDGDDRPPEVLAQTKVFAKPFDVTYQEGTVVIGDISIDTDPEQ